MKAGAIIVCAGKGRRLGKIDKPVLNIKGKPLFYYSLKTFEDVKEVKQIVLVLRESHFSLARKLIFNRRSNVPARDDLKVLLAKGGRERKDSVRNGLAVLDKDIDCVLIHDGARPFVSRKVIKKILNELKRHNAVICGIKAKDTVKIVNRGGIVKETLNRDRTFLIQTPQGFRKEVILEAYRKMGRRKVFDESQLLEAMGKPVKVVDGDIFNFKITYPQDIVFAGGIAAGERGSVGLKT